MRKSEFDGRKLKKMRTAKGLTFLELSRHIATQEPKVSKTSIWQWETGRHEPSMRYLKALGKFFAVPVDEFMSR